jgi:hypothetical protein
MNYQICQRHLALDDVYQAYLLGVSYGRAPKRLILQSCSSVGKVHRPTYVFSSRRRYCYKATTLPIGWSSNQAFWRRYCIWRSKFHALAKRGCGFGFGLGPYLVPTMVVVTQGVPGTQLRRQQRAHLIVVLT